MSSIPRLALAAALLAAAVAPAAAKARIYPAWTLGGTYGVEVPPGFVSVSGRFELPLAGRIASLELRYDEKTHLEGSGFVDLEFGPTFFTLAGTFTVDDAGVQHVHLADQVKHPQYVFDGTVSEDGADIVGTFDRQQGYLGLAAESGAVTLHRDDTPAPTAFVLSMATRMDSSGHVRGSLGLDGEDTLASLTIYGDRVLGNGKIRGRVVTGSDARTHATLTIIGPGWRAKLAGPVDQTGFHAACNLRGGGFVLTGVPVVLAVQPGPTPPPGPPPPAPRNQLSGAVATVAGGKITLSHTSVPSRFFGATAGIQVEFPTSIGQTVTHADPATSSLPDPDPRRCVVTVGGTTYGTATAPADVTLDIRRITSTFSGGQIEVLATGTVVAANGKKKTVDVLIEATVQ